MNNEEGILEEGQEGQEGENQDGEQGGEELEKTLNFDGLGFPDDAVPLPEDEEGGEIGESQDDSDEGEKDPNDALYAQLEKEAEEIIASVAPKEKEGEGGDQGLSDGERLSNIEGALAKIIAQQSGGGNSRGTSESESGLEDAYNGGGAGESDEDLLNHPVIQKIVSNQQEQQEYINTLYNDNIDLKAELEARKASDREERERERFRSLYPGADEEVLDKATALAKQGRIVDATILLNGRSRAEKVEDSAREQRDANRKLSGTPSTSGGAAQKSTVKTNETSAMAEWEKIKAMPPDRPGQRTKESAIIKFQKNYGETAINIIRSQFGGGTPDDAVLD